ncbi:MAG: FMN-binding protein [Oscillospiraceae bacterium]|nr:FMN-binding protein [Oscillospiraceae bacterium]
MSMKESRRDFLKKSSMLVGTAAVLGTSMVACSQEPQVIEKEPDIPAHPWPYVELDPAAVEKLAYENFAGGGCCYSVASALLQTLSEKVGYPYNVIPEEMFLNGAAGYGQGTLCGALGGAFAVVGLVCGGADSKAVIKELSSWYGKTSFPLYQPEGEAPAHTVSGSVNCSDSVTKFMAAANIAEMSDPVRITRCKSLSADVARKTVELLNIHFGFATPAPAGDENEVPLGENEYIGEAEGFGGPVKVKVTMDGDKIAKIDVLSHGETAGVSDPAFETVPAAIIAANSTAVDAVANATVSSKAIMAAVENALSKVK